jgi:hypothetical protein
MSKHGFSRKQVNDDQYFTVEHTIKINAIILPRQHSGWWRVWIELCLQMTSPDLRRHAGLTRSANVFDISYHSRPVK